MEKLHFTLRKTLENPVDTVTVDIPLLIRLLEFAREDSKNDLDLHVVTENMLRLSQNSPSLGMKHYKKIVKL